MHKNEAPQGRIPEFWVLDTIKISFWMRTVNYRYGLSGHFYLGTFFHVSRNAYLKETGTVPVTNREKRSFLKKNWSEISQKSPLLIFFSTLLKMRPSTGNFQGFWSDIQLEHLLNNYFQEQLFWQNTFSDCFWK